MLTYDRKFRSASGVLNAAVFFRKPCIASSGSGNLQSMVQEYQLGIWVEPDDLEAICGGIERWLHSTITPEWDAYSRDNSWQRNAEVVLRQMSSEGRLRRNFRHASEGSAGSRVAKVLAFAPHVHGGIAEHIYHQLRALTKAGVEVRCMVAPSFLSGRQLGAAKRVVLIESIQKITVTYCGAWRNCGRLFSTNGGSRLRSGV